MYQASIFCYCQSLSPAVTNTSSAESLHYESNVLKYSPLAGVYVKLAIHFNLVKYLHVTLEYIFFNLRLNSWPRFQILD